MTRGRTGSREGREELLGELMAMQPLATLAFPLQPSWQHLQVSPFSVLVRPHALCRWRVARALSGGGVRALKAAS